MKSPKQFPAARCYLHFYWGDWGFWGNWGFWGVLRIGWLTAFAVAPAVPVASVAPVKSSFKGVLDFEDQQEVEEQERGAGYVHQPEGERLALQAEVVECGRQQCVAP